MATSELHVHGSNTRAPSNHLATQIPLGLITGLVAYYAIAAVATIPSNGGFFINPLILLLMGAVAAAAVLVSGRWAALGLTAGIVVLAIVAYAVFQGVSWTTADMGSLDPRLLVGFGAASGYPMMVGAVMIAGSALRLFRGRRSK